MKCENIKTGKVYKILEYSDKKIIIEIVQLSGKKMKMWLDVNTFPRKYRKI